MQVISTTAAALKPTAIALGNFDGVHRGHQAVIQPVLQRELALAGVAESSHHPAERVYSTVVTFTPHPREFFHGRSPSAARAARMRAVQGHGPRAAEPRARQRADGPADALVQVREAADERDDRRAIRSTTCS
ncbi:MAG: hypothetical protein HC838_14580, partial [Spirulinaceae cyanobacterium RM2_2_10]|nr:hypothetical protein [Spirulinaceae cyanobacterium RM2_2_10]